MKITEIEKLNQLISRTDMTGNEKVDWLRNFIDKREEQLRIGVVSNRIFTVVDPDGDVINYWKTVDGARKHARELSKKHDVLFEVISEPIF